MSDPHYFCYLLTSLSTSHPHATYIGFTTHPIRRLSQHNREKQGGAKSTGRRGPWSMRLCVSGFPSRSAALQFEWAWQYPEASRIVRQATEERANAIAEAATEKRKKDTKKQQQQSASATTATSSSSHPSLLTAFSSRPLGKIALLYCMLSLRPWCAWNLHVRYLTSDGYNSALHSLHPGDRSIIPRHMTITSGPLEQLDWFASTSITRRREAEKRAQEQCQGSAIVIQAEPPRGLCIPRFQARNGKKKNDEVDDAEEMKDAEENLDFSDLDTLDEDEASHEVIDDDDEVELISPQPIPAASSSSIAPVKLASSSPSPPQKHRHPSYTALDLDGDDDMIDLMADDFAFRYDESSNTFIMNDDDADDLDRENGWNGVMVGGVDMGESKHNNVQANCLDGDEEEEIDLTLERTPTSSSSPLALLAPASFSSSSASSVPQKSSCLICEIVPVPSSRSIQQLTSFGFTNLLTSCPHCHGIAHLLCFQKGMQQHQRQHLSARQLVPSDSPASSSPMLSSVSVTSPSSLTPLLPEPSPCPLCRVEVIWCQLVENCHRFHAPPSSSQRTNSFFIPHANGNALTSRADDRTISQYLLDAAKKFDRIIQIRVVEVHKEQRTMKEAVTSAAVTKKAAKAMNKGKQKEKKSNQKMNEDQEEVDMDVDDDKENRRTHIELSAAVKKNRKRRTRSLTPTRGLASSLATPPSSLSIASLVDTKAKKIAPRSSFYDSFYAASQ